MEHQDRKARNSNLQIGVNLLHAPRTLTGTGHYAHQLLREMIDDRPGWRFTGYASQENAPSFRIDPRPRNYRLKRWGRPWGPVMARRMEEWIFLHGYLKEMNFDVFWGPSNFLPWKKVCPYVASIHDMTFFVHPEFLPLVRRKYWHQWTRRTIKLADRIVTVSGAAKDDIVHYGKADPDRISVIHNGTNPAFYVSGDEAGRPARREKLLAAIPDLPDRYVFFLGTLTSHKNVPRLIDAVAKARRHGDCKDMKLVMAGKQGTGYDAVAEMIAQHHLERDVMELGYTPDDLLPALYENAHVHVLPSFTEGFGLPITEAMAAGTPTITGNRGATAEVAGTAGVTFDPEDTFELRDALIALWTDDQLWKEKRTLGIERANEFTWGAASEKLTRVFEDIS